MKRPLAPASWRVASSALIGFWFIGAHAALADEPMGKPQVGHDAEPKDGSAPQPARLEPAAQQAADAEAAITIGKPQAEQKDAHELFSRDVSVLLKRWQVELDFGLSYMYSRSYDPTQDRVVYSRYAATSAALSLGLASFIQGTISAPLVFHQEHVYSYADSREKLTRSLHPGNITTALNVQILRENGAWPDILLFSDLSIPLGSKSANTADTRGTVNGGFWSTNVGVSFIKSADPVTIFAATSYGHTFERTTDGQRVQIGDFWGYTLGAGLAVNGKVSLSTSLRGGWRAPTRHDDQRIVDTEAEPMSIAMGMIYAVSPSWYLSPRVAFPINVDGGFTVLDNSIAHRF